MELKNLSFKKILNSLCDSFLPNKRDNLSQIILKIVFPLSLIMLITFFSFTAVYFSKINAQQALLSESRQIFEQFPINEQGHYQKGINYFKKQNSDLKGWISIDNTDLSAPIYQTTNNTFYRTHNQLKQKSDLGSLYFDFKDSFSKKDKNLVIYGKSENGLFGCLQNYKSMYYYMQNPIVEFSTLNSTDKYAIFSVFIINSDKKDDGGYIFNYKKSSFKDRLEFEDWYQEAMKRSLYTTELSVSAGDRFITLVTDSDEFKGARLVILAKRLQDGKTGNNLGVQINKQPLYPEIYYKQKQIDNPFTDKEEIYVS